MKQIILAVLFMSLAGMGRCYAEPYKVVFETIDCNGKSGFLTVSIESIYKIQDGDCSDPNNPGQRLKQLLVHDGSGSYTSHTLAQDAAREVMGEVKAYMKARRGALERANTVILTD
ncbi:hypothetical protein [Desulfopila sp. IMCC35008]|uniref:hypothetical protein n=1 Tax=Desulfopila sp. IMCC35008 TaxID=2653858 RepID=UPI0013D849BA|nr:hypothetical protein [Desulfopila sp. IMCC35008]